jgi:TonB family protein
MDIYEQNQKEGNKKRGLFISIGIHVLLLLIAILPLLTYPDPPPEKEGILVNFGAPEQGSGDDRPMTNKDEVVEPNPPAAEEKPQEEQEKQEEAEASRLKPEERMLTEQESDVKIKNQAEKAKEQSEAEKRAEAEALREKQEEAARKAKQKEYEESKSKFSEAFKGEGKGKTDKAGSQGDPSGDPDSKILEGISTGKGKIGGGLSDRGVVYEPPIKDQSQKTGRVVMRVCVNQQGKVISAEYTQRGSTTTDSDLKRIAKKAAEKFTFSDGELEKQCGTITIDFKVQ